MVDGVYVDQIGAASAVACFDPSHGHTLGGIGYLKVVEIVRGKLLV